MLSSQAVRQRVKDILSLESRRLLTEVIRLEEAVQKASETSQATNVPTAPVNRHYQVKLNNYGKPHCSLNMQNVQKWSEF